MFPETSTSGMGDLRTRMLQARELVQAAAGAAEPEGSAGAAAPAELTAAPAELTAAPAAPAAPAATAAPAAPAATAATNPYLVVLTPLRALFGWFARPAAAPGTPPAAKYSVKFAPTAVEYRIATAAGPGPAPVGAARGPEGPPGAPAGASPYIVRQLPALQASVSSLQEKSALELRARDLLPSRPGPCFRRHVRTKTAPPPEASNPYLTTCT